LQTNQLTFECGICQDTEVIYYDDTDSAAPCKCVEMKRYKRIMELSGISDSDKAKTVNAYEPKNGNEKQKQAKATAVEYIKNFQTIRTERNNSAAFLGQPGSGKTHLTIAISNELLRRGTGVLYMAYREVITQLKQVINDDEEYQAQMNKDKRAPVLLIDDLFKGATKDGRANESEMRIMFELINHRYLKQLPMLVSSEYPILKMIDYDDATGSRIAEMCKGRIVELKGKELNHRMEGLI
jgi:DNA replication protein DnaC